MAALSCAAFDAMLEWDSCDSIRVSSLDVLSWVIRQHNEEAHNTALVNSIQRYESDRETVYNSWFVGGSEPAKAFRAIRQSVRDTVSSIAAGTFGNGFRGSLLEVVPAAITQLNQVFEGTAYPFSWIPK